MTQIAFIGTISGRVQGVAFRWSTAREAARLGISGWVRNLPDGRVEIFAQGPPDAVGAMRRFAASGPPGARVESVDLSPAEVDGSLSRFEIR